MSYKPEWRIKKTFYIKKVENPLLSGSNSSNIKGILKNYFDIHNIVTMCAMHIICGRFGGGVVYKELSSYLFR